MQVLIAVIALSLAGGTAATPKDTEWAKGISYTTDWDEAIKEVKETGKILFIYNGWERKGI